MNEIPAGTREIEIVVPGPYNDATDRVHALEIGARLVTRVWYAEELVRSGFAQWPEAAATMTVAELPAAEEIVTRILPGLEADVQAAMEAEKAVQEAPTAPKGKKRTRSGTGTVGKPRRARKATIASASE